jgi:hypothetical protein
MRARLPYVSGVGSEPGITTLISHRASIDDLAARLAIFLNGPVWNRTGLTGLTPTPFATQPTTILPSTPLPSSTPPSAIDSASILISHRASIDDLAARLAIFLNGPVWNRTGLTGTYTYTFRYATHDDPAVSAPSLEYALRDRLAAPWISW